MSDLTAGERSVFGESATRGPDGEIVETGIGAAPLPPPQPGPSLDAIEQEAEKFVEMMREQHAKQGA